MINELLQNSFKYAFRGRDGGRIDIQITNYPLYPRIIYSDNGSGFDPDSVNRGDKGLGLQIVRQIIVNQLKGYMEIRSGPKGTDVTFYFRSSLEP